jgi:NAD(P)-dependent dehydrogenase (short-subunit alcohol dehydrogenase family)
MPDFSGQTIVVTGAGGNLGQAIARTLARVGANLVLADMQPGPVEALAAGLGAERTASVAGADVRTSEGCTRIVETALARFGRIDGLANTVGTFRVRDVADGAADDWAFLMDLNALSALRLSAAVLPTMRSQGYGRICHVAAGAGQKSFAGASVYAASKAAVIRITEAVAEENARANITCNCVMPGTIDTPQNRAAMPDADRSTWVQPENIAAVIALLLSRDARALTGAAVPVTGSG